MERKLLEGLLEVYSAHALCYRCSIGRIHDDGHGRWAGYVKVDRMWIRIGVNADVNEAIKNSRPVWPSIVRNLHRECRRPGKWLAEGPRRRLEIGSRLGLILDQGVGHEQEQIILSYFRGFL